MAQLLPPSERGLTAGERGQLLDLLQRARTELLEVRPDSSLVPEISSALDSIRQHVPEPLTPKEEPTPILSEARLPPWMRQRI
jgi:hypothetical protein